MRQYLQKLQNALSDVKTKPVQSVSVAEDSHPEMIISVSGGKPVFKPLKRSARFIPVTRMLKQKETQTILATSETTGSKILDLFKYFEADNNKNKVMSPLSLLGGIYLLALTASGNTRTKIVNHFYSNFDKGSAFIRKFTNWTFAVEIGHSRTVWSTVIVLFCDVLLPFPM